MEKKKKIIVGMSGGVDSSVSAAILKDMGYDVAGVYFKFSDGSDSSLNDAENIANLLGISFRAVDVRKKFEKTVKRYFLREYENGRTPNPCVICNEQVKFKVLFDEMTRIEADHMATGHYARLWREILNPKSEILNKSKIKDKKSKTEYKLFQAKDKTKDQSYFLYRLPQKYLEKIIFPLGELEKTEVRAMAKRLRLPVADKKESQDVCFLKGTNTGDYLRKNLKLKRGDIIDMDGKFIGEHQGLPLYTIGQRKGINVGGTGPYWVLEKDKKRNMLVVSNDPDDLMKNRSDISLEKVKWTSNRPKLPVRLLVQTRYQGLKVYATIDNARRPTIRGSSRYRLRFDSPQRAAASGQSAVFYSETGEVIGGGIIK